MTRRVHTPWIESPAEAEHLAQIRCLWPMRHQGSWAWRVYCRDDILRRIRLVRREREFAQMQMCV